MKYTQQMIMRNFSRLVMMALLMMVSSCAGEWCNIPGDDNNQEENGDITAVYTPQTEQTDQYTVTYQYQDGILVLPEKAHSYISSIVADTILHFKEDTPNQYLPEAGDIIAARSSDFLPYGLGCKVLSVDSKGSDYIVTTTTASLDEIFSELKVNGKMSLQPIEGDSRAELAGINLSVNSKFNNMNFNGNVAVGLGIDTDIDLAEGKFDFAFDADLDWDYRFGYKINGKKKGIIKEFGHWGFKPVIVGPVVLIPSITPTLLYHVDGSLEMNLEGKNGYGLTMGVKDNAGFCKITEKVPDGWIFDDFNLEGKGSAGVTLQMEAALGIYTPKSFISLNTNFELKGDGELQLDETNWLENNTEFNFGLYTYMNGGVIMTWFKKELALLEVETTKVPIFRNTWPLMPRFVSQDNDYSMIDNKVSNRFVMNGGLMCKLMKIYPVMSVYEDNKLRKHYVDDTALTDSKGQVFAFTVDKDEYDEKLTLKPGVMFKGKYYNVDGKTITFKQDEPKLEIVEVKWGEQHEQGRYWYDEWYVGTYVPFTMYVKLTGAKNVYGFGVKFGVPFEKDENTCLGIRDGYYSLKGVFVGFIKSLKINITPYVQVRTGLDEYKTIEFTRPPLEIEFSYTEHINNDLGVGLTLDYFQKEEDYNPDKNNNHDIKL